MRPGPAENSIARNNPERTGRDRTIGAAELAFAKPGTAF